MSQVSSDLVKWMSTTHSWTALDLLLLALFQAELREMLHLSDVIVTGTDATSYSVIKLLILDWKAPN